MDGVLSDRRWGGRLRTVVGGNGREVLRVGFG